MHADQVQIGQPFQIQTEIQARPQVALDSPRPPSYTREQRSTGEFNLVAQIERVVSQMVPFRTEKDIFIIAKRSAPSKREVKEWTTQELAVAAPRAIRNELDRSFDQVMNKRFPTWFAEWARHSHHDVLEQERRRLLTAVERENQEFLNAVETKQRWALASIGPVIKGHIDELIGRPGYHLINQRYFDAFARKGDKQLEDANIKFNESLTAQQLQVKGCLQQVDNKVSTAVANQLSWTNFKSDLAIFISIITVGYFQYMRMFNK